VNKAELIDALSARLGDKRAATQALDAVLAEIQNAVTKGDKVAITGFGVFEKKVRAARTARNPRTGEAVKVKKTSVPAFRPGAGFRELVASGKVPKVAAAKKTVSKSATKTATKAAGGTAAKATSTRSTATKTAAAKTTKAAPAKKTAAKTTKAASAPAARKTATAKATTAKATPAKTTKAASTKATPAKSAKSTTRSVAKKR
jgi:DNA-binding protein HU-beta